MNSIKVGLIMGLSLMMANVANALLVWPTERSPNAAMSNCDIIRSNNASSAVIDEKSQLQMQLCSLQNSLKMQTQSIQTMTQNLMNTQAQIKVLQQQIAKVGSNKENSVFTWQAASDNAVPKQAFVAGENQGGNVYICQAGYVGNMYPGQLTAKGCLITYGGQSVLINFPYNILVSKQLGYWASPDEALAAPDIAPKNASDIPPLPILELNSQLNVVSNPSSAQPVIGGYESGHYLYICRVYINNINYVGKVVSGNCNVAWKNKEGSWPDYQVLFTDKPASTAVDSTE
jgi:hypothetical protein